MPNEPSVVLISSNRWNSAITEYLVSAAFSLEQSGFHVKIICKQGSTAHKRLEKLPFAISTLGSFSFLGYFRLWKLLNKTPVANIITFGGPETTLVNFMRLPETRRIRFRGQNFHDSWKFRLAVKLSQGYFDYFVAPSKWLAEKLTHATDLEHVHIDLGMDEEKFKVLDIDRREIILTLVARFDPIKGHRRFFKIFSKVMRNWPVGLDAPVLRLIGREENISIPQLRSWGKELEIDKFISIETKRIEQIEEEMNRTTLAIIPSLGSEVICRSAYEFLLCGCPIFVSGAGSLQETIKTPLFGHCYEDRSDDEVAELLLACITDAHKETKEVRAMRSHDANKYYSFQSMGHSLKQLLKH